MFGVDYSTKNGDGSGTKFLIKTVVLLDLSSNAELNRQFQDATAAVVITSPFSYCITFCALTLNWRNLFEWSGLISRIMVQFF